MANMTFGVNIIPKDNTVSIGNSEHPWNINSPNLTGVPVAPTATVGTNTTQVATTAFVATATGNKADKDTDAVVGNFAEFDSAGNPVDSGHKHSDYITSHQDISGKADKVSSATSGDVATLDANGNLVDSGKTLGKSVPSDAVFTDTTYSDMIGATSSVDGTHGLVPAPQAGDEDKYLKGDGTWGTVASAAGTITVTGTITNVSGSYSGTFNDARITSGMKCLELELGTPVIFDGDISVTSGNGTVTIACAEVSGTSTFTASFIASILNSTEYTALFNTKANKVANAVSGNFAALDENGDLVDSGHKHSDYLTAHTPMTDIANVMYPVGSIYTSVVSTSPATLFGIGTWEQIKGRFLYACEDAGTGAIAAGDTGGAKTVSYTPAGTNSGGSVSSHTLTTTEIPSHNHTFTGSAVTSGGISANHTHTGTSGNQSANHTHTTTTGNPSANHTHAGPSHTHTGPSHTHSVGAHAHGLNSHTHTGPSHTHTGPSHTHTGPSHTHVVKANGLQRTIYATNGNGTSKYYFGKWSSNVGSGSGWGVFCDSDNTTGMTDFLALNTTSEASGTGATGAAGTGNTGASGTGATGAASGNTANSSAFDSGAAGTGATGAAGTGATGTVSAWHTHTGTSGNQSASHTHTTTTGNQSAGHTHSVTASGSIGSTGGGGGHSHGFTNPTFSGTAATIATMPPYLAVYMWKRTA